MDRASDSGSEGWGFESLRTRQRSAVQFVQHELSAFQITDNTKFYREYSYYMAQQPDNAAEILTAADTTETGERWGILRNARLLAIIGIVLLAVAGGVFFFLSSRAEAREEAQAQLARIRPYYDQGEYAAAISGDSVKKIGNTKPLGLRAIVEEYSSTPAGKIAALYLGNAYLATSQAAKAKDPYEIATSADDDLVRAAAHAGLAAVYETENAYEKAADEYKKAADEDRLELRSADFLLGAARNYEKAGKKEEAIRYYRMVATNQGEATGASDAALQAKLALARNKVEL